jgi:hypothetical protein
MAGGFGPMRGQRIVKARETLQLFVSSLPMNCKVQIIGFGSKFEILFDDSTEYNEDSLSQMLDHAVNLQANLGGTNLLKPLQHVLNQPEDPLFPRHVFVLTDGDVSNREETIQFVQSNRKNTRVYGIGLGSGADKALVEGVAHAGKGLSDCIPDKGDIRAVVVRHLERALQPTLRNVKVEFQDATAEYVSPQSFPPVIQGDRLTVYALNVLLQGENPAVKITGICPDEEEYEAVLSLNGAEVEQTGSSLSNLAAWKVISELEKDKKTNKKAIEKLGLAYNLATSQTAFSAVFENEKFADKEMVSVTVPGLVDDRKAPNPQIQPVFAMRTKNNSRPRGAGRGMARGGYQQAQHFDGADWSMRSSVSKSSKRLPPHLMKKSEVIADDPFDSDPSSDGSDYDSDDDFLAPPAASAPGGGPPPPPSSSSGALEEEEEEDEEGGGCPPPPPPGRSVEKRKKKAKSKSPPAGRGGGGGGAAFVSGSAMEASGPKKAPKAPRSASATSSSSAKDFVLRCANLQAASGFWTEANVIALTANSAFPKSNPNAELKDAASIWATAIMLAFLALKHGDKEQEWKLVAQKARTFVKKALLKQKASEDFLALAVAFVQ